MRRKCFIGIRIVCFLTLCIFIMYYLSNVLTSTEVGEYPQRNAFWQNINAEDKDTIDIMFVGDSSVMHAINPIQIWKEAKITSYVMSYSVMEPKEAYFDLKKLFSKQSPKYVFIESSFLVKMKTDSFDYFTTYTNNFVDYYDDEISGEIDYYFPVMKYKSAWKTRRISDFIKKHPDSINSVYKGYKYASEVQGFMGEHTLKADGVAIYKYSGDKYFDKIFSLCEENNCKVVLMTVPAGTGWNEKKHDKIADLADSYGVDYLDYDINLSNCIPNFSWKTDTKDAGGHLNYSGATKVTDTIINNYLKQRVDQTALSFEQIDKWNNDMDTFYSIINN